MSLADISKQMSRQIQLNQATYVVVDNIGSHLKKVEERRQANDKSGDDAEAKRDQKERDLVLIKTLQNIEAALKSGSAVGGKPAVGSAGGVMGGVAMGVAGIGRGVGIAAGLAGLGAGLAAFITALNAAGAASDFFGTDMTLLKKQMVTLGEAFSEMPTDGLVKIGALMAAGGALGALFGPVAAGKAAVGMGAIGAGLGAFFAGVALGDKGISMLGADGSALKSLLINTSEGLSALSMVNFDNLIKFGIAGPAVGLGMAGMLGAKGLGALGSAIDGIMGFFSGDDKSVFEKTAEELKHLENINFDNVEKINPLSDAFNRLADSMNKFNDVDFSDYEDQMEKFAEATSKTILLMTAMWEGKKVGSGWFDGLPEMDFKPGLQSGHIENVTAQLTGIAQIAGVQPNTSGETITTQTTELQTVSSMQTPIILSSPTNTTVNSAPMSLSIGGGISSTDSFDQGTR